jgi:hypothetical protein
MANEPVKIEITLNDEVAKTLIRLSKEKGVGVNTLIQSAIMVEDFVTEAQTKHRKLIVEYGPNDLREVTFK